MSFTLQHPESGLYWSSGLFGRVQLGAIPNVYVMDGNYIKNTDTGSYVHHAMDLLHEGRGEEEFTFENGIITANSKTVGNTGQWVTLGDSPVQWIKNVQKEDVPVARAAALIEEALNAPKSCTSDDSE